MQCDNCGSEMINEKNKVPFCIRCGWKAGQDRFEIQHIGSPEAEIRTGPGDPVSLEIRNAGNLIAHCDKDDVWWLHVSDEEFPLRMLIEMMVLLEETLDTLRKTMKDMVQ